MVSAEHRWHHLASVLCGQTQSCQQENQVKSPFPIFVGEKVPPLNSMVHQWFINAYHQTLEHASTPLLGTCQLFYACATASCCLLCASLYIFLRSSSGHPMEQGEKYACAELMVDEIKSAGGIMPKVSQTLAMKPDVVKEGEDGEGFAT